jgi:hypothetical protein
MAEPINIEEVVNLLTTGRGSACVRSGLCCKTGPCAFGKWDAAAHQCHYLQVSEAAEGYTIYACGIKDQIDALPPEAGAAINPAFGAGCCMPLFNANRDAIRRSK